MDVVGFQHKILLLYKENKKKQCQLIGLWRNITL